MEQINSIIEMDELIKKHDMVLVYFDSNSCCVSGNVMPKLEKMIAKYPDIMVVQVAIQNCPELSASYSIFTGPAVRLFIQGKETVREAGIMSLTSLEEKISRYYELFYGINDIN